MDVFYGRFWNNKEHSRNALYARFGLDSPGTGDIYLAKKTTDADYDNWLRVLPSADIVEDVQSGLDRCSAGKGDIVLVGMGTWAENLTMTKAGVRLIGIGATPYATVISGEGTICITVTGVDVAIHNLSFLQTGAAISSIYGTGLIGSPRITRCFFDSVELTSIASIVIAGATSRGLWVERCQFEGGSGSADAVNDAGEAGMCLNNGSDGLNTTEATAFGTDCQAGNSAE